ncbi:MAG: type II toxin-antitoxin system RelE/ParE family toxin [Burkholderiaceae bacterium]
MLCMRVERTQDFVKWLDALKDIVGRAKILKRIDRLAHGNAGDYKALSGGIKELRVNFGPGYRVYYVERGKTLVVLLAGGDKATQRRDIATALRLAENLEESR